jgi:DNA polymerase-3 subunit beta
VLSTISTALTIITTELNILKEEKIYMKMICSKPNLLNCVNTVQKAVSSKSSIPALEGILIKAYDDTLTMMGNDLEIGIECSINADIQQEGIILVNSKFFGDVVRKLPEADVMIEANGESVNITCEHAFFKLNKIPHEDFPEIHRIDDAISFDISALQLKEAIRKTVIAAAGEDTRPILMGVLFEISENNMTLVAIDGFRMALREAQIKGPEEKKGIVIPAKTLQDLVKIIEIEDDIVTFSYSENHVQFSTPTKMIVSRLLNGEFPNYSSIIPRDEETRLTVQKTELLEAFERAAIVSTDEKKHPVVLAIENDQIVITLYSDTASLKEEIEVNMSGEKLKIGFNARYFIEALRVIDDDEVVLTFRGSVGPCLIKPLEGDHYLYLIVPVKIRSM